MLDVIVIYLLLASSLTFAGLRFYVRYSLVVAIRINLSIIFFGFYFNKDFVNNKSSNQSNYD